MQIKMLEAELKKQDTQEKLKNGEEVKTTESFLQLVRNYYMTCSNLSCGHSIIDSGKLIVEHRNFE